MSHSPNLIPGAHELTPEERARGGTNAAKARKERKEIHALARAILDMPLHDDWMVDAEDLPSLNDIESANVDVKTKIIATLAIKALNGNVRAMQTLFTLTGDYTTRQEAKIEVDADIKNLEKAEYHIYLDEGDNEAKYKLVFYDDNGNITKILFGEDAKRLGDLKNEWTEDYRLNIHIDDDEEVAESFCIPLPMSK